MSTRLARGVVELTDDSVVSGWRGERPAVCGASATERSISLRIVAPVWHAV
jgi:hypothetical protein